MAEVKNYASSNRQIVDESAYPRNSKSYTPEPQPEKRINKVVKSEVSKKKKSLGQKISETFVEEDGRSVGEYILFDVVIPAVKDLFGNVVKNAIDMMLYGEVTANRTGFQNARNRQTVNYVNYYGGGPRQRPQNRPRQTSSLDNFVFASRSDAEEVLFQMNDTIDRYGIVSVSDFYQMIGQIGEYTDNKFGWDNLSTARIRHVNGGFVIDLPPVICID